MEDRIVNITEEFGTKDAIDLKTGNKIKVNTKTTYTHYQSGRQDCHIDIVPVTLGTVVENP